jgi:DNA repair protein RecN (Recombination protein N)
LLKRLSIKNYALIDQLSVDFDHGFTTITGETGAGKSIILGGLSLVLGARSDQSHILNKERKCVVEAQFNISELSLQSFFEQNDLDFEEDTIVRREILTNGKSRAFVNDTPVSLQILSELSDHLIDIHTQNQTRSLLEQEFQLEVVDQVADNGNLLSEYSVRLKDYKAAEKQLNQLKAAKEEGESDRDYKRFLRDELESAKLFAGQLESLQEESEVLQNVDQIEQSLAMAKQTLGADDLGVTELLRHVKLALSSIAAMSTKYHDLSERVNSSLIELDDILSDVEDLQSSVESDPERLESINDQLHRLQLLLTKHKVTSVDELMEIKSALDFDLQHIDNIDQSILDQEKLVGDLEARLCQVSDQLHHSRQAMIPKIIHFLETNLSELGMPDAKFDLKLTSGTSFLSHGRDAIEWMFCSSKGGTFQILKKSASGGELSRIMLVVKAMLCEHQNLPALIFDEIDTGVSGEIANKMGGIMAGMSKNMQVIAITHLPQIAAQGNHHFKVYKSSDQNKTVVQIKLLTRQERVEEIATMVSGSNLTKAAIANAKELLN